MDDYKTFLKALIVMMEMVQMICLDSKPIKYWDIMNEPDLKLF